MNRNSKLLSVLAVVFALMLSVTLAGCGQQSSGSAAGSGSAGSSGASDANKVSYTLTIDATDADQGVLFDETCVADKGETVYQVLLDTNLPLAVGSSAGSAYVYGIGDVVVSDKTPNAGWLFTVNGEMPSVGADKVEVAEGDVIVWTYYADATKAM